MNLEVRPMRPDEAGFAVDYFHDATPEHLEMMGVDPTRMRPRDVWRQALAEQLTRPARECANFAVIWLESDKPVGFSTINSIVFGDRAYMHLHVVAPGNRAKGIGAECVKRGVAIYFETFALKRLFCEPNAFNVAPNRTLQRAGFRYVKTHMTVPGQINFHQPVTRWVLEP
jgi:RimJ/RimL family protein N-acetyltransferase